jgi:hypothetical protein
MVKRLLFRALEQVRDVAAERVSDERLLTLRNAEQELLPLRVTSYWSDTSFTQN